MEAIWLAIIASGTAALSAILVPIIMALITNHAHTREKEQDWARQDQVAAKAAEAAALLAETNKKIAASTSMTNSKLDVIHTLVNSSMTAAVQSEYDATVRELAMMNEVIDLKRVAGREPSSASIGAIKATEARIEELRVVLADRLKASETAEAQTKLGLSLRDGATTRENTAAITENTVAVQENTEQTKPIVEPPPLSKPKTTTGL